MVYIKKNKFTLKEAAKIISEETKVTHKIEDLLHLAEGNKIRLVIYKPNLCYRQKKAASNGQDLIHSANEHTAYPLLSFKSITLFLDTSARKVIESLDNIDAIDHEGDLFKITSYACEELIEVRKKDLFLLDIELEKYLLQSSKNKDPQYKQHKKISKTKKRVVALKRFLKEHSEINPHDHKYTRLKIWEKLNEFDDTLFPEWKNVNRYGGAKYEIDGVSKSFLALPEVKNLISF